MKFASHEHHIDETGTYVILVSNKYSGIITASIIWLIVLATACGAALLRGLDINPLWIYAATGAAPAVISIFMKPFLQREWARLVVIFSWLALAVLACLGIGFWPYAILFLCAPVVAALFEREMIIETLILSVLIAGIIYFAGKNDILPPAIFDGQNLDWLRLITPLATVALTLAALYSSAQSRSRIGAFQTLPAAAAGEMADILDTLPGGVLRVTNKDNISFASKGAYELFGLPSDAGHLPLQAISPKDMAFRSRFSELLQNARESGQPVSGTLQSVTDDHTIDVTVSPTDDGYLIQGNDVTARSDEITRLKDTQADLERGINDKTLFFSGVSHELRTPLNAIIGFSDMMRTRLFGPLPGKYAEYADLIHDSGQHMLDLIGDVLDMSKIEAGKYSLQYGAFDMADVVRSSVKMVQPSADAAEVMLTMDLPANQDLTLEADRKALRQILLNLLSNAVKFTPKGGEIKITAKSLADTLQLTVSDNGMGMSADELEHIGEPYTQASSASKIEARGSGLGLSLVASLVELHNGRFAIASQKGEGTTVDVYLPLEAERS
jgi:cell cycle sensor histidine kinase DivJ